MHFKFLIVYASSKALMATLLLLCSCSVLVLVLFVNFVTSYNHVSLTPAGAPAPNEPPPSPTSPPPSPSPPPPSPSPPPPSPPPPPNKKGSSGGLSGGQKAGIVFGVLIGAGLIGFGGFVYKKRKDNMRRGRFGAAARTTFL
ncbi:hypothetical protein ACE6H2_008244 [Prunus campanulata]